MHPLEWQIADTLVNGFFEYLFAYKCCVVNGSGSCTTDVSFDFECISILLLTMCYDFVERIIPLSVPSALQAVRLSVFTRPEALFRRLPGSLNNFVKYFQQFPHDTLSRMHSTVTGPTTSRNTSQQPASKHGIQRD
jgi:hypothetical protein